MYKILAWASIPVLAVLGIVCALYIHPEFSIVNGTPVFGLGVALGTALIEVIVLLIKTVFFCCIWIWVRWTLPRFRYDHVMHLGWKVILNIALINLVVTALIAKLAGGN